MSLFENPENLQLLRNLLNPPEEKKDDSDLEDNEDSVVKNKFTPGSIGSQNKPKKTTSYKTTCSNPHQKPKSLEEWQLLHEQEDLEILDNRKIPSYTMTYRQAVGTEDVFFQIGNRTNASASCEDLVVDILLPDDDTSSDKMQLNITETELDLSTPIHHLKLPLVHKVNVDRCRAKFQPEQHKLTLILRLQRELDFVNF